MRPERANSGIPHDGYFVNAELMRLRRELSRAQEEIRSLRTAEEAAANANRAPRASQDHAEWWGPSVERVAANARLGAEVVVVSARTLRVARVMRVA